MTKRVEIQFDDDDDVYLDLKRRADMLGLSMRMYIEQLLRADYWIRQGVDPASFYLAVPGSPAVPSRDAAADAPASSEQSVVSEEQPPTRSGAAKIARNFMVRPQPAPSDETDS